MASSGGCRLDGLGRLRSARDDRRASWVKRIGYEFKYVHKGICMSLGGRGCTGTEAIVKLIEIQMKISMQILGPAEVYTNLFVIFTYMFTRTNI